MRHLTLSALVVVLATLAALTPSAHAAIAIPVSPVRANPADRLLSEPIEASYSESASRCRPRVKRRGTEAFIAWLQANADGVYWGSYRCEKWGLGSASLHAEKRAVDWHLNAGTAEGQREAQRIVVLLTAPDASGNLQALARRMGVEEIIWDCAYWSAGMAAFRPYAPCYDRRGKSRKKVNLTVAHRDHIHFGLTRAGARGATTFWRLWAQTHRP